MNDSSLDDLADGVVVLADDVLESVLDSLEQQPGVVE